MDIVLEYGGLMILLAGSHAHAGEWYLLQAGCNGSMFSLPSIYA